MVIALIMKAASTSKMSANISQTTRHNNPEGISGLVFFLLFTNDSLIQGFPTFFEWRHT
jgi:hypothetical protein